jgi:aminoglycoside phosphotransferase (APT) family kinase protein
MTQASVPSTGFGLDTAKFETWIAQHYPDLAPVSDFKRLTGGHSNISIAFHSNRGPMVLRRPPLGHVMQTAHDMSREYRVLQGLDHTPVPTPEPILHANDPASGVDAEFFVMTMRPGFALTDAEADAKLTSADRIALSHELIEKLADLHAVDISHPQLAELGRPAGFRERQVSRWNRQLEATKDRDLPATVELGQRLTEVSPQSEQLMSVVHGDYKFNNTLVELRDEGPAEITAILDWEMATLGDPLTDLAVLGIYWNMPTISPETRENFETPVTPEAGYPSFDELIDKYVQQSARHGITIPTEDLNWYFALAAFKIAVIVESLHYRYVQGLALDDESATAGQMTEPLARAGLAYLKEK